MNWAYGVTTVSERFNDLLPRTLDSLEKSIFNKPHIFIDGGNNRMPDGLDETAHRKRVRCAGNWVLSLYELYILNPKADRYAIFQDDCVAYKNLKLYLEQCTLEEKTYWNLYTFHSNLVHINKHNNGKKGWSPSNQLGRGAVGLVFTNTGVRDLLSSRYIVERFQDDNRGYKAIDGGIVTALKELGYTELVHNPSLLQHTGSRSTTGNNPHQPSPCWYGEDFDALDLLKQ